MEFTTSIYFYPISIVGHLTLIMMFQQCFPILVEFPFFQYINEFLEINSQYE